MLEAVDGMADVEDSEQARWWISWTGESGEDDCLQVTGGTGEDASRRPGRLGSAERIARAWCEPGVTTKDLDEFAERHSAEHEARPAFKGYRGYPGVAVHFGQSGSGARDSVDDARC